VGRKGTDLMEIKQKWMGVEEVSKYIGVSKETTYRLLLKKQIPSYRIGKLHKFEANEIDAWIKSDKKKKKKQQQALDGE
jgi:excisionase family DNA binding protein